MNVLGEEVEGCDGESAELSPGDGVRTEEGDAGDDDSGSKRRFYATGDGSVQLSGEKIEVLPIANINGDVTFKVGHIETRGDVAVSGSVLYGFNIKCAGTVVVGGEVENGASIQAGGDVAISQRVVRDGTRVVAGGSIECKLVQNATVIAQGDITVGNSLMNAHVRSGKEVVIQARRKARGEYRWGRDLRCGWDLREILRFAWIRSDHCWVSGNAASASGVGSVAIAGQVIAVSG